MNDVLYIVIPCYNEEEVLPETERRLTDKLNRMISAGVISPDSKIVFIDNGSYDGTWPLIQQMNQRNPYVYGVKVVKNRGHQNGLVAGYATVVNDCDMVVSMDADLQDDIEVLDQFVEQYKSGYDIVYGVRSSREKDSFLKRTTAQTYYKFLSFLGVDIVYNHADYRLMSQRALRALLDYKEANLFLRGLIPMIGYPSTKVEYERSKRFAGKSKYSLKVLFSFAADGITSLSVQPIRLITAVGALVFLGAIIMIIYSLIGYFSGNSSEAPGWTSLILSIWAIGGIQLLSIGIVGEYIGKIYLETNHRPRFIVETYLKEQGKNETIS